MPIEGEDTEAAGVRTGEYAYVYASADDVAFVDIHGVHPQRPVYGLWCGRDFGVHVCA
ncbi:hypothetical protein NCCNTM_40970 [Mycolicibacterium sp. NCC-Tsukiji]|nr:hypothetical protein NCCNTM_40970 [Mycolicibacterium sp. NCC-Tsukiji]